LIERVITWEHGKRRPSAANATKTMRGQFPDKRIETDADRIYLAYSEKHWIEVVMGEGGISVVTRNVNHETETQAERLTWALTKAHGGEYVPIDEDELPENDDDEWDEEYWV
jgi:hypothetical protein